MLRPGILLCLLPALALVGCVNADVELFEVNLAVDVSVDPAFTDVGSLQLQAHHAFFGSGELRHPLGLIESWDAGEFTAPTTTVEHSLLVPLGEGSGLAVYAYLDIDDDAILCNIGQADEPSGIVVVDEIAEHSLALTIVLESACFGPEGLHP